jgi:lysophospholipase L1-like esterase
VNLGVGGDGTAQVLWRLEEGVLDGLEPKVIALGIGVNNTWSGFGAEDTAKGIAAVLEALKTKAPKARVLLLGNTHYFDKGDGGSRRRVRGINEIIAKLADGDRVKFLDFSEKLLNPDGGLNMEFYNQDKLHLGAKAYELWAAAMDPALDAWLK